MKKTITTLFLLAVMIYTAVGQKSNNAVNQRKFNAYAIGFYNLENLFDTCHDAGKNDYQFLPNGTYKWNGLKYSHKLRNMAQVLADMGTDVMPKSIGCAAIGVSEVENSKVLDDLIAQPALASRGYKYAHIEGPDRRGVDCALLYNPKLFDVYNVKLVPYVQELEKDSTYFTRGFLTVSGKIANEDVTIIVCHWPSRMSESFYRESAGRQVRTLKDALIKENPNTKILVMGDLNDDPTNNSIMKDLGAKSDAKEVGDNEMFNPWYNYLVKQGVGTLSYKGAWNLFDQIILSPNLLNRGDKKDFTTLKYWKSQIFSRDYLLQSEGQYKGTPKRTTSGGVWIDGYSDHLPVIVYLSKEVK